MLIMTSLSSIGHPDCCDFAKAIIINSHGDTTLGVIDFSDYKAAIIRTQNDALGHRTPLFSVPRPKFTTRREMVIPLITADGYSVGEIRLRNKRKSLLSNTVISTYSVLYEGRRLDVRELKTETVGPRWSIYDSLAGEPVVVISEERFVNDNERPFRQVVSHHIWAKGQQAA